MAQVPQPAWQSEGMIMLIDTKDPMPTMSIVVLALAMAVMGWGNQEAHAEGVYSYVHAGKTVTLEPVTERVAVRLSEGASAERIQEVLGDYPDVFWNGDVRFLRSDRYIGPKMAIVDLHSEVRAAALAGALSGIREAAEVYSTHLVFRDRPGIYPETYTRLLEPIAAAANLYRSALRARTREDALPCTAEPNLSATALSPEVVPTAEVLKIVAVEEEILTDVLLAVCREAEEAKLFELNRQHGVEVLSRHDGIGDRMEYELRLTARAREAGYNTLDLVRIYREALPLKLCLPHLHPIYTKHYRYATQQEVDGFRRRREPEPEPTP